jgi:glucose-1-phosphate adenylyltransferase
MISTSTSALPRTQALILAGGQGKRLYPLTVSRPKPAIPFGGIFRIVDFTLSNCLHSKLHHAALLTQYLHEELHSYIRLGWSEVWKNSRHTTEPLFCLPPCSGKRYRGTADAVFHNLSLLQANRPDYVLILSGDHVYHMDYRELLAQHVQSGAEVTVATLEHSLSDANHFGVVEVDNELKVTGFEEKPESPCPIPSRPGRALISMGVYAFNTDVLIKTLKENCESRFGYDFGDHILPSLIDSARVYAYDFHPRYWRDIGTIDSYYRASMDLVRPGSGFSPYVNDYEGSQITHHPSSSARTDESTLKARVHSNCQVSRTVLSPGVRIEEGATVEDSVLMPGVRIAPGAAVRRAIVMDGVQIPSDFRVGWDEIEDRKRYTLSPDGVVVVSHTPKMMKPTPRSQHAVA